MSIRGVFPIEVHGLFNSSYSRNDTSAPSGVVLMETTAEIFGHTSARTGSSGMYRCASFASAKAAVYRSWDASRAISGRAVSRAQRARDERLHVHPAPAAMAATAMMAGISTSGRRTTRRTAAESACDNPTVTGSIDAARSFRRSLAD